MITSSAPGKVILFGEHAVVYDKLSIAAAIDRRVLVEVNHGDKGIKIFSKNFKSEKTLSKEKLSGLLGKFRKLKEENNFDRIKKIGEKDVLSPLFIVIANILEKYGFKSLDLTIKSDVPKNLGSSSAVFVASALAVSKFLDRDLPAKEISKFAYQGDIIAHGGTPSGIDNNVVTYGGFIQYKKSEEVKSLDIDFELPLVIIDSGEPTKTSETVPAVRKLKEKNPEFVNLVLDKLGEISYFGIEALKSKNLGKIGRLMTNYYVELKKLRISTPKLDQIIDIALENKALGAKPTGGWGGGCCVVLAKNQKEISDLIKIFKKNNFNAFETKIGFGGVKLIS